MVKTNHSVNLHSVNLLQMLKNIADDFNRQFFLVRQTSFVSWKHPPLYIFNSVGLQRFQYTLK